MITEFSPQVVSGSTSCRNQVAACRGERLRRVKNARQNTGRTRVMRLTETPSFAIRNLQSFKVNRLPATTALR
jgi:hypothetical protein